jgi:hypothetical protein
VGDLRLWVGGGDARIDDFSLTTDSTSTLSGTCSYPAQLLDLSEWKLQLPTGDPVVEIKNPPARHLPALHVFQE